MSADDLIQNYAGDLLLPSAPSVVKTALAVFPRCRVFRETAAPSPSPSQPLTQDLANMVIFCRKTPEPFNFRAPAESDFLGSHARREHLLPKYEIDIDVFLDREAKRAGEIITARSAKKLSWSQRQSARNHWHAMRTVLPARVWQYW